MVDAFNATGTGNGEFAITDANGNYQIIQNLATGTYNVEASFTSGYLNTTVTSVAVTAGAMTSNVNLALPTSGVITGTVTNANSGATLQGISVEAIDASGNFADFGSTTSTGQYTMNTNLPTGTYNVTVLFPTGYLSNTLTGISVTAGATTTANIALSPSGAISGTATNVANGQPISGVSILVSSTTGGFGFASTDSSGNYQVNTNLGTGTYTVEAIYGTQFVTYPSSVSVTAGQTTPSINFQLTVAASGTISGQVTSSSGGPVIDASVSAQGPGGLGRLRPTPTATTSYRRVLEQEPTRSACQKRDTPRSSKQEFP